MRRMIPLAALALVAAACSGGDSATTEAIAAPTTSQAPVTTAPTTTAAPATTAVAASSRTFLGADGVEVDVTDTSRIVSLNGDITEILFELGHGGSVVGIDVTTTYPEEATAIPVVGFGQMLSAEGVLAFSPTLVIGDQQVGPPETIQQLRDSGVAVAIIETQASLEGVATKIAHVAEIVDEEDAGGDLGVRVDEEIAAAKDLLGLAGGEAEKVAYVYARGPQTVLLFGAGMPTQAMIEGAGAVDVGAAAGVFGPAPLTPEALVAAAPDVIVLPAAGFGALGGAEALLAIPGIAETPAGQSGRFLVYEEGYFFGLGPRTGQALEELIRDLYPDLG